VRSSAVLELLLGTVVFCAIVAIVPNASVALAAEDAADDDEREFLVPAMRDRGLSVEPGTRPYADRLGFSPAIGRLGNEPYYALRASYHPSRFLGWEAHLGHNPSESVHALVHALLVQLRWPLPWRLQPYLTVGYGMMLVFPGRVFEADPVTENQIGAGAGLEFFLRDDVALRGEIRGATITGSSSTRDRDFDYREFTVGLVFYRTIEP